VSSFARFLRAKIQLFREIITIFPKNIRLSQYVKEHLSRMQSRACTSYTEAMVFFEALASKIARAENRD